MQYIILLGIAYVTKYLTRLEVFPDDLDKFLNLPVCSSHSSREHISQNVAQVKARFIGYPHNLQLSISKSNFVKHDIGCGEKGAWDTAEGQLRLRRHKTQDFKTSCVPL